jgi:hypothetical protein
LTIYQYYAKISLQIKNNVYKDANSMELEKILENLRDKYGEDFELVIYSDGSGHVAKSGSYVIDDEEVFSFVYFYELIVMLGDKSILDKQ